MKKLFNHLRLFLFLSALVMLLVSCSRSVALEEPSYTLNITQQPAYTVVSYNQFATLSCKAESECQPVSYHMV